MAFVWYSGFARHENFPPKLPSQWKGWARLIIMVYGKAAVFQLFFVSKTEIKNYLNLSKSQAWLGFVTAAKFQIEWTNWESLIFVTFVIVQYKLIEVN
jgi:hypothetical protein